jgi:hypothetical protein
MLWRCHWKNSNHQRTFYEKSQRSSALYLRGLCVYLHLRQWPPLKLFSGVGSVVTLVRLIRFNRRER